MWYIPVASSKAIVAFNFHLKSSGLTNRHLQICLGQALKQTGIILDRLVWA